MGTGSPAMMIVQVLQQCQSMLADFHLVDNACISAGCAAMQTAPAETRHNAQTLAVLHSCGTTADPSTLIAGTPTLPVYTPGNTLKLGSPLLMLCTTLVLSSSCSCGTVGGLPTMVDPANKVAFSGLPVIMQ